MGLYALDGRIRPFERLAFERVIFRQMGVGYLLELQESYSLLFNL